MIPAASVGGIVSRHDADNICLVQQDKGEEQAADRDESEAVSVGLESVLQATRWRTIRLTVANQKVLVYQWYHEWLSQQGRYQAHQMQVPFE